ncbi:unnamed protein product [Brassica napus]|uniref:(rape) hypothetical protein n=1 Tax=Brassica napus TaxID=3708 RepID=A0A816IVM4_BRANA|nr:unnamed protein product [Brassica napus]
MIEFPSYSHFIFPLILFFKYLHIKKRKFSIDETDRDERLQGKKTETGLSSSPLSPSEFVTPNPKPTLVSLSISSHVCSLGLGLPLQRTYEIHIPNPSWMQSPSYKEAWNEPHIWFRPNKVLIFFRTVIQSLVIYNPTDLKLWEGTIARASKCWSSMKIAFGGVDSVIQPPRQPDRSNKQTGTSNALAFPSSKSTQKGVTECSCCWSNFTSKELLCAKRQKMLEDMEKDFEEADKFDGGVGSKSSGSLDIRFRVEKVQAPLCDWKMAKLEYSL